MLTLGIGPRFIAQNTPARRGPQKRRNPGGTLLGIQFLALTRLCASRLICMNLYGDAHDTSFKANRRASPSPHEACRLAVRHPEGNRGEIAGSTPARFMDCRQERVDVREKSGDRERPDDADSRLREC